MHIPAHLATLLPAATHRFLDDMLCKAQAHGVKISMSENPHVPYLEDESLMVSGYFVDRPTPQLSVALGKPLQEWLGVLVHEACHMQQWIEGSKAWTQVFMPDGREAVDWLNDWVARRKDLDEAALLEVIARCRQVELDCEKRAVECIKTFDLPIDVDSYTQKAQAYVYYYDFMARTRSWYEEGQAPYELPQVYERAPTFFTQDLAELAPLFDAFERTYLPPRTRPSL